MYLHANAKLGLAGRFALVRAVEEGMSLRRPLPPSVSRRRLLIAGGIAGGRQARTGAARCRVCSTARAGPPLAAPARARAGAGDLCLPAPDRLGPEAGRWRDRLRPLDRLEGAPARRHLAAATVAERAGQPLRVALPRRPAAHGRLPLRALSPPRPPLDGNATQDGLLPLSPLAATR
jgi:hypothetical protein